MKSMSRTTTKIKLEMETIKSKEVTLDSKHQSKNKTRVQENRERYCLHVGRKFTTNSLSKEQTKTTTK